MGDVGETFNALRKQRKQKRAENRDKSAALLTANNIHFTTHNGGAHLIVQGDTDFIDFWPGTGTWIPRNTNKKGFGVFKLIEYVKK